MLISRWVGGLPPDTYLGHKDGKDPVSRSGERRLKGSRGDYCLPATLGQDWAQDWNDEKRTDLEDKIGVPTEGQRFGWGERREVFD